MNKYIISLIITILFIAPNGYCDTESESAKELIEWITGSFSTSEQAAKDSTYINLTINIFEIWADQKDGHWLYLETSFTSTPDKPYKQQIFHLSTKSLGLIKLDPYSIPQSHLANYNSDNPMFFKNLTPDSIISKNSCSIYIKKNENSYFGATSGERCSSTIRGAKYAVTDIDISKKELYLWERGYDFQNNLVWGNKDGGYIFKKDKKENK